MKFEVMHFALRFRNVFFSLTLLMLMVACMDDDNFDAQPVDVAYVSLYHALPSAPDMDIIVDGRKINNGSFSYGDWSGYLNFITGKRNILFQSADAGETLIDTAFSLQTNKAYSLFAIPGASSPEALLVVDSAGAPATGKAMVRFVHLSPDASAVDLQRGGDTPATLFKNGVFKSASDFMEVDEGNVTLTAVRDGDTEVATKAATFTAGKFYTVVLQGLVNPTPGPEPREAELVVLN